MISNHMKDRDSAVMRMLERQGVPFYYVPTQGGQAPQEGQMKCASAGVAAAAPLAFPEPQLPAASESEPGEARFCLTATPPCRGGDRPQVVRAGDSVNRPPDGLPGAGEVYAGAGRRLRPRKEPQGCGTRQRRAD